KAQLKFASPAAVASLSSSARSPTAVFAAPLTFLNMAESPIALLLNPVMLAFNANAPTAELNDPSLVVALPAVLTIAAVPQAVFRVPSTLSIRAAVPTAVFASPWLRTSVPAPTPVLKLPVKSCASENQPNAEFALPVMTLTRELVPSAVLNVPPTEAGSGVVCAFGANASHTRMSGMRRNPRHNGSERAGSRPHETNLLTWFNEYMDVFFLFPGRVWIVFFFLTGILNRQKTLPGKSPLSVLDLPT